MPNREKNLSTEHENQKPGSPPRPATEPAEGGGHPPSDTATDPQTGESNR